VTTGPNLPSPFDLWNDLTFFAGAPAQVCENSGQGVSVDPRDDPPGGCGSAGDNMHQNWSWFSPLTCETSDAHYMDWTTLGDYCNAPGQASNAEPCNAACTGDGVCNKGNSLCVGGNNDGGDCCPGGTCGVDGVIHMYHEGVIPTLQVPAGPRTDAVYDIQVVDSACSPSDEISYSLPLRMTQAQWGDAVLSVADCPNGAPDQNVSVIGDTTALINKFSNVGCALQKARADLLGAQGPNVDFKIDISDILASIAAFQGYPYPFRTGQCVDGLCNGGPDHGNLCTNDLDCRSDPCAAGMTRRGVRE
jgi:hypothetical protein